MMFQSLRGKIQYLMKLITVCSLNMSYNQTRDKPSKPPKADYEDIEIADANAGSLSTNGNRTVPERNSLHASDYAALNSASREDGHQYCHTYLTVHEGATGQYQ
jgi:hypothetical protein